MEAGFQEANQFTQYAYYLYKREAGILQKDWKYSTNSFRDFDARDMEKDCVYYVKVFVRFKNAEEEEYRKDSQKTREILIPSTEFTEKYSAAVKDEAVSFERALPFWKTEYPYQDILAAYGFLDSNPYWDGLAEMAKENGLLAESNGSLTVAATQKVYPLNGRQEALAFSGITRNDSRLIYGWKDMESISAPGEIENQIGNWFGVFRRDGKYILEADYFGFSKLYYYKDSRYLLVSNRYHLLLLAMTALHIPKRMNHEKAYAYLSKISFVIMQNFSREMNVAGVRVLPVDSRIIINPAANSVEIEKGDLFYDLSAPPRYEEKLYRSLLRNAADEIIDNARVALESPHFQQFIVDVTGGLDSRTVLSALTKFPQYKDKIIPHSAYGENYESDIDIAVKLISRTPFDFRPRVSRQIPERDIDQEAMSYILGVSSEYSMMRTAYQDALCFPGFCGEVVGRPYYTKRFLDRELADPFLPHECFFKEISGKLGSNIFDADCELASILSRECALLPGRNSLEKYDLHYLYYRNGIHFNDTWRASLSCCYWSILQSKKMLRAKYMLFPNDSSKAQFDLLYLLNPELAKVEFNDSFYNEERAALHKKYGIYPVSTDFDAEKLKALREKYEQTRPAANNRFTEGFKEIYQTENLVKILNVLVNRFHFSDEIAQKIYLFLQGDLSSRAHQYFLVKLVSLYFELTC